MRKCIYVPVDVVVKVFVEQGGKFISEAADSRATVHVEVILFWALLLLP